MRLPCLWLTTRRWQKGRGGAFVRSSTPTPGGGGITQPRGAGSLPDGQRAAAPGRAAVGREAAPSPLPCQPWQEPQYGSGGRLLLRPWSLATLLHRRISLLSELSSFNSRWMTSHLVGFRGPALPRVLTAMAAHPSSGSHRASPPPGLCFTGRRRRHGHPLSATPRLRDTPFTPQALRQRSCTPSSLGPVPEIRVSSPCRHPPSFSPSIPHSTVSVNTFSLHAFLNSCTALKWPRGTKPLKRNLPAISFSLLVQPDCPGSLPFLWLCQLAGSSFWVPGIFVHDLTTSQTVHDLTASQIVTRAICCLINKVVVMSMDPSATIRLGS